MELHGGGILAVDPLGLVGEASEPSMVRLHPMNGQFDWDVESMEAR